jgi:LCP family protein required for cell wall assembly
MKKIINKFKQMSLITKIISIIVGIIFISSIILVFVINSYMNKINYIEDKFEYITDETLKEELDIGTIIEDSMDATSEEISTEESTTTELPEFEFKEGITNILLIGADRQGTNGYGRSDSCIILSLDTNNKTIKMASILRDSYVSIPGYNKNKINASYAFGGPDLLIETIEANFGIKLDKYIYVDFEEFKNIIDALDGVDINLTEKETSKVFGETKPAGKYHLNGEEALLYARIRKIDSDFVRTSRQRTLLMSLYEEYKSKSISEAIIIATDLLPYINTNLTKSEIIDLISTAVKIGDLEILQHTLPANNTYRSGYTDKGAWIIDMDLQKNSELLYEFIYGEKPSTTESTDIENVVIEIQ